MNERLLLTASGVVTCRQVGVGILALEYRRNERNAEEKKRKEEAYRAQLDADVHRDREVSPAQSQSLPSLGQTALTPPLQLHAAAEHLSWTLRQGTCSKF